MITIPKLFTKLWTHVVLHMNFCPGYNFALRLLISKYFSLNAQLNKTEICVHKYYSSIIINGFIGPCVFCSGLTFAIGIEILRLQGTNVQPGVA